MGSGASCNRNRSSDRGVVASGIRVLVNRLRRKDPAVQAEQTLESRLAALGQTMGDASELLVLVETELEARAEKARQLDAEVKRPEQLALLTQEQKEAVREVLRDEIVTGGRKANWLAFVYGFLFFLAGSVVTFLFTYVHH
jgi:hypothetical protein